MASEGNGKLLPAKVDRLLSSQCFHFAMQLKINRHCHCDFFVVFLKTCKMFDVVRIRAPRGARNNNHFFSDYSKIHGKSIEFF